MKIEDITCVMLSWKRPDNIKKIINKIKDYGLGGIIVCNNNKDIDLSFLTKSDVLVISHNKNNPVGLMSRITSALYASTEFIMTLDDDRIPTKECIEDMVYSMNSRNGDGQVGLDPRCLRDGIFCGCLKTKNGLVCPHTPPCFGYHEVESIITGTSLFSKKYLPFIIDAWEKTGYKKFMDGEDMFISFCIRKLSGLKPILIEKREKNKDWIKLPDPHAISLNAGRNLSNLYSKIWRLVNDNL